MVWRVLKRGFLLAAKIGQKKKKVLCTFYFRTTVTHGTHSIPKVMSGFAFI